MSSAALDSRSDLLNAAGRRALYSARILLAGAGNINSFTACTLAEAGCRLLRVIDRDRVEERNVENQVYEARDVGRPKAEAIADHIRRINPRIEVEAVVTDLEDAPLGLFRDVDLCLAGLDSLRARQVLASERAWPQGIVTIDGAVDHDGEPIGSVEVIVPGGGACLECRWGLQHYQQLSRETPCDPHGSAGGPPTGASALLGASVASLMVREAARVLSDPPRQSYQVYFDLRGDRPATSRLRRAAGCRFDHAVIQRRIPLGVSLAQATIGDVLRAIDHHSNSAQFQFRRRIFDGPLGGNRWMSIEQLTAYASRRLAELGLSRHDRIRVKADGSEAFLDLDGTY